MDLWHSILGMVQVELISADPTMVLRKIESAGIVLLQVQEAGEFGLLFVIKRTDLRIIKRIAEKSGAKVSVVRRKGQYWNLKRSLKRPVLAFGTLLILGLSIYLPSRILFVQVEGNQTIPAQKIIEEVANCGLGFGTSRRDLRSEKLKNALLEAMPELQWAGVNTYGCRAVVSVREREIPQEETKISDISSIVATRDGVIQELTVTQGTASCRVGQSVKEGQILISGYTDLGTFIRGERAEGEVYALTQRSLEMIAPSESLQKMEIASSEKKYSLIIGKNRINFFRSSGISDTTCDKMYSEYYITLPGGSVLPIAIAVEERIDYELVHVSAEEADIHKMLERQSIEYLSHLMIAGHVQQRRVQIQPIDGGSLLRGDHACYEMIGKRRLEEIIENYEDGRTQR